MQVAEKKNANPKNLEYKFAKNWRKPNLENSFFGTGIRAL